MLAASKVKMSSIKKESEQEHKQSIFFVRTYDISFIESFTLWSCNNNGNEMYKKSVLHVQTFIFC